MKAVSSLLKTVHDNGFKGVYPLYIQKKGQWTEDYALFELEFEKNDDDLAPDLCDFIEENIDGVNEVYLRNNEFEVIGNNFPNMEEDEWWGFPVIEEFL